MLKLENYLDQVVATCRAVGVKKLDLFGSAAHDDFGAGSDVDVVVEFLDSAEFGGLSDRYFKLKEDLERLFDRKVDVVMEDAIKNPIFRKGVNSSRIRLYAA